MRYLSPILLIVWAILPARVHAQTPRFYLHLEIGNGRLGIADFGDHFYLDLWFCNVGVPYSLERCLSVLGAALVLAILALISFNARRKRLARETL